VQSIRHLASGTTLVITDSGTVFPGEAEPPEQRQERVTWVLSGRDGRWLIEAYHSCPANAD
jgi:uncharacterized protein (TIGR02246 family)